MNKHRALYNTTVVALYNFMLAMVGFILCRIVFILENRHFFTDLSLNRLFVMFKGGFYFDLSALLYTNALYFLLMLIPFHYKEGWLYQKITKGIFVTINLAVIVVNLADAVYFQYTNRRTTATIFKEFAHENNSGSVVGKELITHWYFVFLIVAMGYALYKFYRKPHKSGKIYLPSYYLTHTVTLFVFVFLCICGMRGGFGRSVRPITISNASQYVNSPIETAIVLNTPFALYRTFGKTIFSVPEYWTDRKAMQRLYSPVHVPADTVRQLPLNVVVIILESFGKEYFGYFNKDVDGGMYKGYTPFLDSLMTKGLTYQYSFSNGRKSIDGISSVFSGIPMFVEPFISTSASLNAISSFAGELKKQGYYTSFFHGARNGSMGFEAYTRASGFTDYYGRSEYNNDKDFDGYWGIWDEEFLQYFAQTLSTFKQPFASGIFTLSSHHPFQVPARYKGKFPQGKNPIHKCIGYSDYALRRFFEVASRESWFDNTLFVITADHTNQSVLEEYQTGSGLFAVPILFYHANSGLKGFVDNSIAQQIDIMPTVLGYLGYDKPYISFGCDLFNTPPEDTFAVNYFNGFYQYFKGNYLLQFDGKKTTAVYRFKTDILLKENILEEIDVSVRQKMEDELKAIIQQYMERMVNNELTVSSNSKCN
ncbi:Lipoteichoic acid synthase 1 [termite gut metagenome]|uniref:Lipoteichoic acid synthase 1 n=1 Tax=termite gut metagenome TaxID=433724 RepID=A0A5J4SJT1_9ZZZZ